MKGLKMVLLLFVVSRCLIFAILSIGRSETFVYANHQLRLDNPVVDAFVIYDSYNYAQIAEEGYSEVRLTAFFPLFPLMVRGLAALTGLGVYGIGVMLSNIFFLGSLWLLYRLMDGRRFSERAKWLALGVMALFPSSYFFSAFYTESFFLFLALSAFLCWERERRGVAWFIGGLAALTRIVGVWIPLAFFLERAIRRKLDGKDFAFALMSALMFAAYPAYLWWTRGAPLSFLEVQDAWFMRSTSWPFAPVYRDVVATLGGKFEPIILFHLTLLLAFAWYLARAGRLQLRSAPVPWAEVVYTTGLVVTPLCSINYANDIASLGLMRYVLTGFPLFIFMGGVLGSLFRRAYGGNGIHFGGVLGMSRFRFIAWKFAVYLLLFMWVFFSMYILLVLRYKGFVA